MSNRKLEDERVQRNRVVRRVTVIILAILILLVTTGGALTYVFVTRALEPVDANSTEKITIEVPYGVGSGYIGQLLEDEGLVRSGTIFRYYTRFKNESSFQAGTYTLSPSQSLDDLIATLKTGKVLAEPDITIVIPEGITMDQWVKRVSKAADIEVEQITEQIDDREYIGKLIDEYEILTDEVLQEGILHPLEGYLYPATYEFEKGDTLSEIIESMLDLREEWYVQNRDQIEARGLTFHELLSLAAVVEKEAVETKDRKEIAGVFENRLNDGMKLQSDPTVWYGTGESSIFTSSEDLQNDSLYNTYRYEGIPIGPIAMVSTDALEATLTPNKTKNFYFYARPPRDGKPYGEVLFEESYDAHLENVRKYRPEWEAFEAGNE